MKKPTLTDEQYRTITCVLNAVTQADSSGDAVWLGEHDREKLEDALIAFADDETLVIV